MHVRRTGDAGRSARASRVARTGHVFPVVVTTLLLTGIAVAAPGDGTAVDAPSEGATVNEPDPTDRAAATAFLLDSPRPPDVVDRSLEIAEKLRQRYGIETGHPFEDRLEAARRARFEFLDRLRFDDDAIRTMAGSLGYSLDPGDCRNWCENVRELARIELQRRALEAFANGKPWPGRLVEDPDELEIEIGSGRSVDEAPDD